MWVLELNTKCKAYIFVIRLFLGLQNCFLGMYIQNFISVVYLTFNMKMTVVLPYWGIGYQG